MTREEVDQLQLDVERELLEWIVTIRKRDVPSKARDVAAALALLRGNAALSEAP